MQKLI
jgi:hypothetical protein